MFNHVSPNYKGIVLGLIGYTAFSGSDICIKWLTQHYSVYQVISTNNSIGALILLAFSAFLGGYHDLWERKNFKIHALRALVNLGVSFLAVTSLSMFPLADVYVLLFTVPFFSALLVIPLYGERLTPTRFLAIAIGFVGVVIAMRPGQGEFDPLMIMPLVAAVLIAVLFIIGRSLHAPSSFSLGFVPMAVAGLAFAPLMLMNFTWPALAHMPVFILAGSFGVVGFVCVSQAFRMAPAAVVAPFFYTEMIWGVIFGYLIFSDVPDIFVLGGAAVVIASGLYVVETERRSRAQ